jgi:hypothetical protein
MHELHEVDLTSAVAEASVSSAGVRLRRAQMNSRLGQFPSEVEITDARTAPSSAASDALLPETGTDFSRFLAFAVVDDDFVAAGLGFGFPRLAGGVLTQRPRPEPNAQRENAKKTASAQASAVISLYGRVSVTISRSLDVLDGDFAT